jgi:hypothetical protein
MAQARRRAEFEIEVAGEVYVWRLHRRPQWSSDVAACRGMALAVRIAGGQREAMIEFPPGSRPRLGAPQVQAAQVPVDLVAKAIASALAAGWEPLSRGKTVVIVVDALGG